MLLSYVAVVILSEAQNLYISLLPLLLLLLLPLPLPLFPTVFQHQTPPPGNPEAQRFNPAKSAAPKAPPLCRRLASPLLLLPSLFTL